MSKLPDKLSDLIELALSDLAKVERSKRYAVDMKFFHRPKGGTCHVCFAGAVMAKTLGNPINQHVVPSINEYHSQLIALDVLRHGHMDRVFQLIQRTKPQVIPDRIDIPDYKYGRAGFKRALRKLVRLLREYGE